MADRMDLIDRGTLQDQNDRRNFNQRKAVAFNANQTKMRDAPRVTQDRNRPK